MAEPECTALGTPAAAPEPCLNEECRCRTVFLDLLLWVCLVLAVACALRIDPSASSVVERALWAFCPLSLAGEGLNDSRAGAPTGACVCSH